MAVVAGACQLNIGLFAFNLLLPAYPLDGGRILADLLLICRVGVYTAAKITAAVATLLGAGVLAFGIWRTLETSGEGWPAGSAAFRRAACPCLPLLCGRRRELRHGGAPRLPAPNFEPPASPPSACVCALSQWPEC